MKRSRMIGCAGMLLAFAVLTGCAKDLTTGRGFTEFQKPPEGKAIAYFIRSDNGFADKPPYMYIGAAGVQPGMFMTETPPFKSYIQVAIVGKENFVPIQVGPGDYYFRNALSSERISVKGGDILCFDVGSKFRGVSVWVADQIKSLEECRALIADKLEGVQLNEARMRIGYKVNMTQAEAQSQIVLTQKAQTPQTQTPVPTGLKKDK